MEIHIHGKHVEVTPALKDYAMEKAGVLKKFIGFNIRTNITLSVEKFRQRAEVAVTGGGVEFHGVEESEDMYASIDKVMDKIAVQAKKFKEKLKAHPHVRSTEIAPDMGAVEE